MYPPGDRGARVHYAVPGIRPGTGRYFHRVAAAIARGKHPVPSRTRKLSPSAPMVLRGRPRGRVGHRRTFFPKKPVPPGTGFFALYRFHLPPLPTCTSGRVGRGKFAVGTPSEGRRKFPRPSALTSTPGEDPNPTQNPTPDSAKPGTSVQRRSQCRGMAQQALRARLPPLAFRLRLAEKVLGKFFLGGRKAFYAHAKSP